MAPTLTNVEPCFEEVTLTWDPRDYRSIVKKAGYEGKWNNNVFVNTAYQNDYYFKVYYAETLVADSIEGTPIPLPACRVEQNIVIVQRSIYGMEMKPSLATILNS